MKQNSIQRVFTKAGLGEILEIKCFEQGIINEVYSINEKYVLKINTKHLNIRKLDKEFFIYQALAPFNIPVPTPITVDNSLQIISYPYLIYNQLQGEPLNLIFKENNDLKNSHFLQGIGELLGRIHSINKNDLAITEKNNYFEVQKSIKERINIISGNLLQSKIFSHKTISNIENFYNKNKYFKRKTSAVLLHGNYTMSNIIVDKNNVVGIIDWEWASFGDKEEELALMIYRLGDDNLREIFKLGYLKSTEIHSNFEKRYFAYVLLYYLKILPDTLDWIDKPEKQKEYMGETLFLLKKLNLA